VAEGAVVWMSSIDGQIGTGPSFVSGELSPGVHEIHVEVSDSARNTSIASIEITVDPDLVHTPPADAVEVEALFVALMESTDDRSTTTTSSVGAAPPSPVEGPVSGIDPRWLVAVVAGGTAFVIGALWNGRRRRSTG
jgi:hypothetical protein